MRLEQLEYLIEIQKNTSLSAAAQKLHISSQALSKSISSLEDELGYALLNRTYKGVQLTEKADQVILATKHFLAELEAINDQTPAPLPILKGHYVFHSIQGEVNYFLLTLLTTLSQDFPLLETNVLSHSSSEVERLVQTQEIDFGMYCTCSVNGVALTSIPDNLRFTPLLPCRLYALIPNKLPLTVYKSVSIKSLLPYPLIMQRTGDDETPALLSLVKQFGKPKQVISKSSAVLCHELVYAGIGIYLQIALHSKLPQIQDAKQVTILPIRDEIELTYGYLTAADSSLSATSEIILRYIQEQAEVMLNAPA